MFVKPEVGLWLFLVPVSLRFTGRAFRHPSGAGVNTTALSRTVCSLSTVFGGGDEDPDTDSGPERNPS